MRHKVNEKQLLTLLYNTVNNFQPGQPDFQVGIGLVGTRDITLDLQVSTDSPVGIEYL